MPNKMPKNVMKRQHTREIIELEAICSCELFILYIHMMQDKLD